MKSNAAVAYLNKMGNLLPTTLRDTLYLRTFAFLKIPLIFWVRPKVLELSETTTRVLIPLNFRTKNHLGSMYFGVLATGADCAGGLSAMKQIMESGKNVSLAFKSFHADFLKRPEDDVVFTCTQGLEIKEFVQKVLASEERLHMPVRITATCPNKFGSEPMAEFTLELSLKRK